MPPVSSLGTCGLDAPDAAMAGGLSKQAGAKGTRSEMGRFSFDWFLFDVQRENSGNPKGSQRERKEKPKEKERETCGKGKRNQRETKGKPRGTQRETKGKPKGNQWKSKGKGQSFSLVSLWFPVGGPVVSLLTRQGGISANPDAFWGSLLVSGDLVVPNCQVP